MNSFDATFRALLLQRIAERTKQLKEELAGGVCSNGTPNMDRIGGEYMKRVGFLQALDEVQVTMEDILKEMRGD